MKEEKIEEVNNISMKNIFEIITILSIIVLFRNYLSAEEMRHILGTRWNEKVFQNLILVKQHTTVESKITNTNKEEKEESNTIFDTMGLAIPMWQGITLFCAVALLPLCRSLFTWEIISFGLVMVACIYFRSRTKESPHLQVKWSLI